MLLLLFGVFLFVMIGVGLMMRRPAEPVAPPAPAPPPAAPRAPAPATPPGLSPSVFGEDVFSDGEMAQTEVFGQKHQTWDDDADAEATEIFRSDLHGDLFEAALADDDS